MKFINFKNKLQKNDIRLFDSEYRNIYSNMKILNLLLLSEQKGGGDTSNTDIYYYPFSILDKNDKNNTKRIHLIIDSLKSDNFNKAKFACKKSFVPLQRFT